MASLAHSAARGAFFTLAAQGAKILLQLLSVVVLARLLTPHDYGLIAIVLVVVGMGEIFRDFGLTSASIQALTLSRGQRDNLFWLNALIGVGLAIILFALSWPIAALTGEDEMVGIMQALSSVFILNGLATQYRASLMRDLRFRPLAIIDVAAAALALGVAVLAAALGAEYWALVAQQICSAAVVLVGSMLAGRWIPRRWDQTASVRTMVSFGWNIVATNLLIYAGSQADTILVGMRFGTSELGLYNRAFQVVMTPLTQVRSPLKSVAVPVLSRVQNDIERFSTYVRSAQLALGYSLGIPLAIIAGAAVPVVDLMLGDAWSEAAPLMRMFAIAGIFTTLSFVGYWVYLSQGLGKDLFRFTIISTIIKIVSLVIGSQFGLLGVGIAFAVAPAISWPLSLWWISRVTTMPTRALYEGAGRVSCAAILAGVAAWLVAGAIASLPSAVIVVLCLVVGVAAASLVLVLPIYRRDARALVGFVSLMLKRGA